VAILERTGVHRDRIWVDPGIGFGKTVAHNLALLRGLGELSRIGGRLAIGTSRKGFLATWGGEDRVPGTLASNLWAREQGASVFRVHDVGAFRRSLDTWEAIRHASQ
jgi:dihydropteroate synthase